MISSFEFGLLRAIKAQVSGPINCNPIASSRESNSHCLWDFWFNLVFLDKCKSRRRHILPNRFLCIYVVVGIFTRAHSFSCSLLDIWHSAVALLARSITHAKENSAH
jgi:hypothetical protein